jgi:hypothetical protein
VIPIELIREALHRFDIGLLPDRLSYSSIEKSSS